ncbi:MAG: hypothetical protein WC366_02590 [Bacilli bacterium]|jgi:hypothetical protein
MKKQKWFFVANGLIALCIPLALLFVDTSHFSVADMAGAKLTEYTIRLDSTNTPEFLSEEPLPTGSYLFSTPSRSVVWSYETGMTSYPEAHLAMTDLASVRSLGNNASIPITGVLSIPVSWMALNGLTGSNINMNCYPVGGEFIIPPTYLNLNGLTSPHTFTRADIGDPYSSLQMVLQVQADIGAPNAIFVLNYLEIVYDCIPAA